tara:strand:+ start:203 stop:469 length:267 start_codon:yes stop_codon:yes gene_type:complete
VNVVPIKNAQAIEQLEKLRDMLLSGEATKFYAFTDVADMETAVVYGGDWDLPDVIAALGALQGMEIKACLDALFGVVEEEEEEDYPEE